jgi:small-conductance mechanosensitive channel
MELHIGAKISLAGGKIAGTVLSYSSKAVRIRTEDGKKIVVPMKLIETIQEAFV